MYIRGVGKKVRGCVVVFFLWGALALADQPLPISTIPIYFPKEEKSAGLLKIEKKGFSIGAELKTGFLIPQGDMDYEFYRGDPAISHDNEKRSKFRIDRLMLIPQMNVGETIVAYAELEAFTNRNQGESTFFREGHLSFYLPKNLFVKVGLEDRWISPEFMATNELRGDNKKLTEVFPINGTAFWEDEDLGVTFGGNHSVRKEHMVYWRTSIANGLRLEHDEITRNQIYPLVHDDRHSQSLNLDLSDNKEFGFGLGFKNYFWSDFMTVDTLAFLFEKSLVTQDIDFLTSVIPNYVSNSRESKRIGFNNEIHLSRFNLFSQYVYARDGHLRRHGFYFQPSYFMEFKAKRSYFNAVRFLYRFNILNVGGRGIDDNVSTSPFTWDRIAHSFAAHIQIYPQVLLKNELHLNLERVDSSWNPVNNNEFLSQLEVRF